MGLPETGHRISPQGEADKPQAAGFDVSASEPTDAEGELFRPEAMAYSRRRLTGEVVITYPTILKVYAAILVFAVLISIVLAATATYSRKETVSGWLQPENGLIRATTLQAGVIEALAVAEGDEVARGAILATVRLSHSIDEGQTADLLQASLEVENSSALGSLAAGRETLSLKRRRLLDEKEHGSLELAEAQERIRVAEERVKFAEIDKRRTEKLVEQGALPTSRLEAAQLTYLSAVGGISTARSQLLGLEEHLEEIEHNLAALPAEEADMEARSALALAQIKNRITSTAAQTTSVITAPIDGRILAVPVNLGQSVPAGGTIGILSPAGSGLVAELYVPSRAAGFIKPGKLVRIMFAAFPHEKFGTASARVTHISHTVLGPSETAIPGLQIKEPVFRVRAELDRQDIAAYGETLPLQPGMLLAADVVIDERSLLEWLLDPLYAAGRR